MATGFHSQALASCTVTCTHLNTIWDKLARSLLLTCSWPTSFGTQVRGDVRQSSSGTQVKGDVRQPSFGTQVKGDVCQFSFGTQVKGDVRQSTQALIVQWGAAVPKGFEQLPAPEALRRMQGGPM